jgi:methionine-R-sulfoxide reductase
MKAATLFALAAAIMLPNMKSQAADLPDTVTVRLVEPNGDPGAPQAVPTVRKTDAEWKKQLGDKAYEVLRAKGTEPAFCGTLLDNHKEGVYFCAACDLPLFTSRNKFDSGTGWPSFFAPFAKENVAEVSDMSYGMDRTEILCARCGGHLGHVFNDGPAPTHLRFCLNSVSLKFRTFEEIKADAAKKSP